MSAQRDPAFVPNPAYAAIFLAGRALLTVTMVLFVCGLAFRREFYESALSSAFLAMTLAACFVLYVKVRPAWLDAFLIIGCTVFLWGSDLFVLHFPRTVIAPFSLLGLSSLLILGLRATWAKKQDREQLLYAFVPVLLFVTAEWMTPTFLDLTSMARPKVLDMFLLSFDGSLGVQLSFLVGAAFKRWLWLRVLGVLFYVAFAVPIMLIYGGQLVRKGKNALPAAIGFLITGPVAILFFNLFPALGPAHLFPFTFPFNPPSMEQVRKVIPEPVMLLGLRNAIPSLHMAWPLLAFWYSRGLSWWSKGFAIAFVIFTALATLGTGEHYFVDLVVAFPFVLMIRALCTFSLSWKSKQRMLALLAGFVGTLCWFALLRFESKFFWISPVVPWAFLAATVVLCGWQLNQLELADSYPQSSPETTLLSTLPQREVEFLQVSE